MLQYSICPCKTSNQAKVGPPNDVSWLKKKNSTSLICHKRLRKSPATPSRSSTCVFVAANSWCSDWWGKSIRYRRWISHEKNLHGQTKFPRASLTDGITSYTSTRKKSPQKWIVATPEFMILVYLCSLTHHGFVLILASEAANSDLPPSNPRVESSLPAQGMLMLRGNLNGNPATISHHHHHSIPPGFVLPISARFQHLATRKRFIHVSSGSKTPLWFHSCWLRTGFPVLGLL